MASRWTFKGRNGREVTNPIAKALILVIAFVAFLLLICIFLPLTLLLHLLLRVFGRHGCIFEDTPGKNTITIRRDSFRRRKPS